MQASGFTEQISLVIPSFHAVMPDSDDHVRSAYPYPSLSVTGPAESREISVLTLENAFLKVQWAPSLGGRMVSCFDKRAQIERLSPLRATQTARGDGLRGGVALEIGGAPRGNALGPVDAAQLDAEDAAGFILAETAAGTELSWHQWVRLRDDSPVIEYEIRVVNRSLSRPAPMVTLSVPKGMAIDEGWEVQDGTAVSRLHPGELGPQATATLTARLTPIAPDAESYRSGAGAIVAFADAGWTIYPTQPVEEADVTVLISTAADLQGRPGQTFEASVTLSASQPLFLSRSELPPESVDIAIRDRTGQWWLSPATESAVAEWSAVRSWPENADPAIYLNDPLLGHVAAIRRVDLGMGHESWDQVDTGLDRALGSNAENPLAWWRRAARERLAGAGDGGEDGAALSNAHYLAPLEPLLRAEAFLNQSPEMGPEPSPLVKPMQSRPEHLVEVAARWLEAGRPDQATRWINESLRHVESPMLLYLQAYAFLRAGRMEVEIPNLLRRANEIGYQPPFPYRDIEREALSALQNRFPDDILVAKFRHLMA